MSNKTKNTENQQKKNRKGIETNELLSMRVGTTWSNIGKIEKIKAHLLRVKDLKNEMSAFCFADLKKLLANPYDFKKNYVKFEALYLTAHEKQKLFHDVVDTYENHFKQLKKTSDFVVQTEIKYNYYKKKAGSKRKGDFRSMVVETKKHELSGVLKLMTFMDLDKIEDFLNASHENDNQKKVAETLKSYYGTKYWPRMVKIVQLRLENLLRKFSKPHHFTTGSYRKEPYPAGKILSNGKIGSTHSPFIVDETNAEFKLFLAYKISSGKDAEVIRLPISFGKSEYHKKLMKEARLDASYIVTLTPRGKIDIIITRNAKSIELTDAPMTEENTVALDINAKHNLFACSDGSMTDYDRKFVKETLNGLVKLETLKLRYTQEGKEIPKQVINKIGKTCRAVEANIKKVVSETLNELSSRGVKHIVLEDLDLSQTKASLIRNDGINQKYSKLIRNLRLSSVKHWMDEQGSKRGIRIHTTQHTFSSQECPRCHHIDAENRKIQEEFKCVSCGLEGNADHVAAINLKNRFFSSDVLRDKLHNLDERGNYKPKSLKHETLRKILELNQVDGTRGQFGVNRSAINKNRGELESA